MPALNQTTNAASAPANDVNALLISAGLPSDTPISPEQAVWLRTKLSDQPDACAALPLQTLPTTVRKRLGDDAAD